MTDESPDAQRRGLAQTDPLLPEICFGTRPLYGVEGVLLSIDDASKRPYEQVFVGRVHPHQARGLAKDLDFMLRLQQFDYADHAIGESVLPRPPESTSAMEARLRLRLGELDIPSDELLEAIVVAVKESIE